jgi:uncharacterized protein (TIGR02145 family)
MKKILTFCLAVISALTFAQNDTLFIHKNGVVTKIFLSNSFDSILTYRPEIPFVSDVDGNLYSTILINNQTWMASNLRVTKLNDGTDIQSTNQGAFFAAYTSAGILNLPSASSVLSSNFVPVNEIGMLYNFEAASNNKICPVGWHVPTAAEFDALITHLGGTSMAGGALKQTGTNSVLGNSWAAPNTGATNSSGMKVHATGFLNGANAQLANQSQLAGFWTSTSVNTTTAAYRGLWYQGATVDTNAQNKKSGFSIRCIKD